MKDAPSRLDFAQLVLLAAIWGGSFIFMRIAAPVLGPLWTATFRVGIAGVALGLFLLARGVTLDWARQWRHYLVLGFINTALPFSLYSFAALHIPASYSVILNATSPLFGAVFSLIWLQEAFTLRKGFGLFLGTAGVAGVVNLDTVRMDVRFTLSAIACLTAASCYALGAVYLKKKASHLESRAVSAASLLCAGGLLLPLTPLAPMRASPTWIVVGAILGLSLVCSALAYLIYYRLIGRIGPTRALTVTFLMPVFGVLWGFLFLGETITWPMVAGTLSILLALRLVRTA